MTWDNWIEYHGTLFALTDDMALLMMGQWVKVFDRAGYSPEQMTQATDSFALNSQPLYRGDHLQTLLAAAKALKCPQASIAPPEPANTLCGVCGDSGRVSVPNPKSFVQKLDRPVDPVRGILGRWTWAAVLCSCAKGHWFRSTQMGRKTSSGADLPAQQTIEQYECDVPNWRDLVAEYEQSVKELRLARDLAKDQDDKHGRLPRGVKLLAGMDSVISGRKA